MSGWRLDLRVVPALRVDLRGITLICQDWGSLIGLRVAMENQERFARIVVANGFLPTGDRDPGRAFKIWRAFATYSPVLPVGRIVPREGGVFGFQRTLTLSDRVSEAYVLR